MANRYWVGGTGNWSDTARWATTSGGASGASVPVAVDNVFFDANSGTGTATTTTGATCTIVTLNSSTLSLVLGDNFTHTGRFNFTLGSLSLGTYTWTCNDLQTSNSNVRSLDFGTGKVVLTGSGATILGITPTNLTFSGSKLIEASYAGAVGTRAFTTGLPTEANVINLSITAGTDIVQTSTGDGRIGNLNLTGFAGTFSNTSSKFIYGDFIVGSGVTLGAGSAAITFAATSGTQQITTNGKTLDFPIIQNNPGATLRLQDNLTMGSTRTFTLTAGTLDLVSYALSAGRFACSASTTTRSVTFGTGNITLTDNSATILSWGNSNLTATGSKNIYATYSGGTGTRTFSMNATGLDETNVPNILITAGTDTVSSLARVRTLDFTGFKGTYNSAAAKAIFGGLIFDPDMTITGSASAHNLSATTGPFMIRTAGLVMDFPISVAGAAIGGIWEFDDALTMGAGRRFAANAGTIKFKAGTTNTSGEFVFVGTSAVGRQITLSSTTLGSQYTLSQASGTVTAQFTTISDSNATGGATWNAFTTQGNIDAGNNDGWDFLAQVGRYIYTRRKNKRILL